MSTTLPPWPNMFIVGAAKAGTTSLQRYLCQHPSIGMAKEKEPHYFSDINRQLLFFVGEEKPYRNLFKGISDRPVRGEASPSYLWDPGAPERIAEVAPDARIIISLRDPIERAFSHYLMDVGMGTMDLTFLEALKEDQATEPKGWGYSALYIELGQYSQQISRYFDRFGPNNVHVLFFKDLVENTPETLDAIFKFLDIDPDDAKSIDHEKQHNVYREFRGGLSKIILSKPKIRQKLQRFIPTGLRVFIGKKILRRYAEKPTLPPEAREFLQPFFAKDLEPLELLLGKKVPWRESVLG